MKPQKLISTIAIAAFAALVIPTDLAAQDDTAHAKKPKHHHYQLIDMGTFGGPNSFFNFLGLTDANGFGTVFYLTAQISNAKGTFVGFADTSMPDPYPAFCYTPDCFVSHAFQWSNGVKTDLGALPGGASSAALWINARGWITGNSENGETDPLIPGLPEIRAVLWNKDGIRDLGTLGGSTSITQAMNDRGQITGLALNGVPDPYSYYYVFLYGFSNGTQARGFLWDPEDGMQDLGTLGGPDAFPGLINQRGQVAGFSYTTSTPDPDVGLPPFHPFLWEKGKGMKDLGSFGGVQTAAVNGLNEQGEVVGGLFLPGDQVINPFLWDGEKLIDLSVPPFGTGTGEANWINEIGEVVGVASLPVQCPGTPTEVTHAFRWRNGVMADLGSLAGLPRSRADFINNKSQVVGASFPCDFSAVTAFLWEHESIVDLNTLISTNSPFYLLWAPYIDGSGVIGALGGLSDGDVHAVLLNPCDENHPGIEGCDYSMVEGSVTTGVSSASAMPTPTSANQIPGLHGVGNPMLRRFGRGLGPWYRGLGAPTAASELTAAAPASAVESASTTVTLTPSHLGFSCRLVGVEGLRCVCSPQNAVLTNTGNSTLDITAITTSHGFGQTHTCGTTLGPKKSCSITISTGGLFTREFGQLLVADTAPGTPQSVSLSAVCSFH